MENILPDIYSRHKILSLYYDVNLSNRMNENQVGVLQIVNGNDAVEFFHVHRKKSEEDMKWVLGEIIDTRLFSRSPSKNIWKKLKGDAFEAVRQEKFTKMPSRSTCLFASATLETAKVWYDTFYNRANELYTFYKRNAQKNGNFTTFLKLSNSD